MYVHSSVGFCYKSKRTEGHAVVSAVVPSSFAHSAALCPRLVWLPQVSEFLHFACTSEDVNNLSYALMMKVCPCG